MDYNFVTLQDIARKSSCAAVVIYIYIILAESEGGNYSFGTRPRAREGGAEKGVQKKKNNK